MDVHGNTQVKYASLPNFEEKEEDFRAESVLLRRRFTEEGKQPFQQRVSLQGAGPVHSWAACGRIRGVAELLCCLAAWLLISATVNVAAAPMAWQKQHDVRCRNIA